MAAPQFDNGTASVPLSFLVAPAKTSYKCPANGFRVPGAVSERIHPRAPSIPAIRS
ncbi:hypothetical protein AB4Y64_13285 [Lysobacter sp. TAF61]|uniref:hypothetical protein n=1 Tax=Lysobacter sp. TAF61 TaxID=3233072 RepID=UPI003F982C2F